jgi:hypothetical protein
MAELAASLSTFRREQLSQSARQVRGPFVDLEASPRQGCVTSFFDPRRPHFEDRRSVPGALETHSAEPRGKTDHNRATWRLGGPPDNRSSFEVRITDAESRDYAHPDALIADVG